MSCKKTSTDFPSFFFNFRFEGIVERLWSGIQIRIRRSPVFHGEKHTGFPALSIGFKNWAPIYNRFEYMLQPLQMGKIDGLDTEVIVITTYNHYIWSFGPLLIAAILGAHFGNKHAPSQDANCGTWSFRLRLPILKMYQVVTVTWKGDKWKLYQAFTEVVVSNVANLTWPIKLV